MVKIERRSDISIACVRHSSIQTRAVTISVWWRLNLVNTTMPFNTFETFWLRIPIMSISLLKAKAWFNLGEFDRARIVAQQCLVYEPFHLDARLTLGRSLLELGDSKEATRIFHETLNERGDHIESFQELVFLRYREGDIQWLQRVLLGEVENYASIPSNADIHIAEVARQRIGVAVSALVEVGAEMIPTVLDAIHCSQDEHLRFALWEVAVYMAQQSKAVETSMRSASQDHVRFRSWDCCA